MSECLTLSFGLHFEVSRVQLDKPVAEAERKRMCLPMCLACRLGDQHEIHQGAVKPNVKVKLYPLEVTDDE